MDRRDLAWLLAAAALGLAQLLPGLAHPSIASWDESVHQAAARGVLATPLTPHIFADPLYAQPPGEWVEAGVFIHKPILPFWLAALGLRLLGITPLALRLVSLLGVLLAAGALFALARPLLGRPLAAGAAATFLSLPFVWRLTQGYQFGDATDCAFTGAIALSLLLLARAAGDGSRSAALEAGLALGAGFLCKSALALAPAGVACALVVLGALRLAPGLRARSLLWMLAAFALVALPWEISCALRWPELWRIEWGHTLHHFDGAGAGLPTFARPWDAIWNGIAEEELAPLSPALALLAACALAVRAARSRELPALVVALWLWGTWITLAFVSAKAPALAFGAVPAALVAVAALIDRARQSLPWAAALCAAALGPQLSRALPQLSRLRALLPAALAETRARPGLFEGLLAAGALALLAWGLRRALAGLAARERLVARTLGIGCAASLLAFTLAARAQTASGYAAQSFDSHTAEVGAALARATPERSVLFAALERYPPCCFPNEELIFWSGRMSYRRPPDPLRAVQRGYHPDLVSATAEPYQPVEGVPPQAWLRAYDLARPASSPPLPEGVRPLSVNAGFLEVIGFAAGPATRGRARYAFYARSLGALHTLDMTFETADGDERVRLDPFASLAPRSALERAPWFVLPMLGPPLAEVQALSFASGQRVALRAR
jgi:4-amino-4-deoxy-L-arabinose transferase-like glycosyltransferase